MSYEMVERGPFAPRAGLTIYDMCKAVDRGMQLDAVRLVEKRGGRSGTWLRPGEAPAVDPGTA